VQDVRIYLEERECDEEEKDAISTAHKKPREDERGVVAGLTGAVGLAGLTGEMNPEGPQRPTSD
jgi:hypothetical protein